MASRRRNPLLGKRVRRGTADVDGVLERRYDARVVRLDEAEFTRRQRYRDTNANTYAPARPDDPIYRALLRANQIDALDTAPSAPPGLGPVDGSVDVRDEVGTEGRLHGRALLYCRMPRNAQITEYPHGQVTFVDPETHRLFTGNVKRQLFIGRRKSGYVVLDDVVEWGQISDPAEFMSRRRTGSPR